MILLIPIIPFGDGIANRRSDRQGCKKIAIKQLKNAPKRKGGKENQSFEDWTDATNVAKTLNTQLNQRI